MKSKQQKQEEAVARNSQYAKLTLEEKIHQLEFVPGGHKKQSAQFAKLLSDVK